MTEKEARPDPARALFTEAEALAALARLETLPNGTLPAELHAWATDYRLLRQVVGQADVGIAVFDRTLRYRYVNGALAALNGLPADEHIGHRIGEVLPDINVESAEHALTAVLKDGVPRSITVRGTTRSAHPSGQRWWHNSYHRLDDPEHGPLGVAAMVLEITSDRVIRQSLDRARKRLALLDRAATRIGTTLDMQRTCEELTQLLVSQLADIAAVDVLQFDRLPLPPGPLRMRRVALTTVRSLKWTGHYLGAPGAVFTTPPSSALTRCVDQQQPIVLNRAGEIELQGLDLLGEQERADLYRKLGLHSGCYVPLAAGHDTVGVVALGRTDGRPPFSDDDMSLITELVRRAANSIDNAQRYAKQRDTAVVLQRALLSKLTTPHPDVECASRYLPSGSGAEVGGDWYDTIALPSGITLLVVGDVMGHGLDAAATMAEYRATVRTLAYQQLPPDRILTETDALVQVLDLERMATCLVIALDPRTHTATCASAGHLPPLLAAPGRPNRLLDHLPVGPPLGAAVSHYEHLPVELPPGSALLLYTDGLVERRDQDIDHSLAELASLSLDPAQPLDRMLDTALSRLSSEPGEDDVALLIARIRAAGTSGDGAHGAR
ncbi:SpoIIE family protein phosphatase [Streptomyces sp. NPDC050504]|uniref:SpoIIE family protein phosphatase n=1 Tax=Streptomyces sp. NPDC050504 TaxID=3365618 RepID=UPI0037B73A3A